MPDPYKFNETEIRPKVAGCCIFDDVCYNFRLEVASDVISGVFVELVGMDDSVQFGDSRSTYYRDLRAAHFVMDDECRRHRRAQVNT